jgi:HEAT repeat protein
VLNDSEQHPTEEPVWLAEALDDPDPNVRIQALETWAQHLGETLDPLTYALVDPEEKVRARAQELLEEKLARR